MKPCVYCDLQIEDDAIVCRYCTRQIPQGAVTLDYPGRRFGLGRTATTYALWDLTSSTPPLSEFQLTEAGWDDAWYRFQQMETEWGGTAHPAVPASPEGSNPIYPTFPLGAQPESNERPAGRGLTIGAWVCAGLAVLILPIIVGPAGMVLGLLASAKGDRAGRWAALGALGGMILGLLLALWAYRATQGIL